METQEKLAIAERITSYFLALDAFEELEAISSHFTPDARWECFNFGADRPVLAIHTLQALSAGVELQAAAARSSRLRHHVTGLIFSSLTMETGAARIKVLVTEQPRPGSSPKVRNTAVVTSEWRKVDGIWLISLWRIQRDSSRGNVISRLAGACGYILGKIRLG